MLEVWTSINGDDDNDQWFPSNYHGNDGGDDDGEVPNDDIIRVVRASPVSGTLSALLTQTALAHRSI